MMRVGRLPAATIRSTTPEFAELSPYRLSAPYSVVGLQKGSVGLRYIRAYTYNLQVAGLKYGVLAEV